MTPADPITTADRLLLAVVAGGDPEGAAADLGVPEADVPAAAAEVRRRIVGAADLHRDAELTDAIARLDELYRAAQSDGETKDAIAAQKELNKLRGLYRTSAKPAAGGRAERELDAIDGHLRPLQLADASAGPGELARLAVAEIVRLRHGR